MLQYVKAHGVPILAALVFGSLLSSGSIFVADRAEVQALKIERLEQIAADNGPIVKDMRIIDRKIKNGSLYIHVVGLKLRQCGPVLAITGTYGNSVLKSITFLNDVDESGNIGLPTVRPISDDEQDFGWWELTPDPSNDTDEVLFRTFHSCPVNILDPETGTISPSTRVVETLFTVNIKGLSL